MNKQTVTFVEAGGHYGMTTDFVLEDQPEWNLVVLEPTKRLYEHLLDKYQSEPRVRLLHAALWNCYETRTFYASGHPGASSLCEDKSNMGECEEEQVDCLRASTFLSSLPGNILLNLNCEGAEIEIMNDLMDAGMRDDLMIFVQNHKPVMPKPELYDELFARMDRENVNYLPGTYGKLHKGAIKLGLNLQEFLIKQKKPNWAELFSPGIQS